MPSCPASVLSPTAGGTSNVAELAAVARSIASASRCPFAFGFRTLVSMLIAYPNRFATQGRKSVLTVLSTIESEKYCTCIMSILFDFTFMPGCA